MAQPESFFVEFLRFHALGEGIQRFRDGAAPLPDVPAPSDSELAEREEGSLDFILADPSWTHEKGNARLLSEWRRLLKPGGVLATVVPSREIDPGMIGRLLVREVGLVLEEEMDCGAGYFLLVGRRDPIQAIRRNVASLGAELGRRLRPEGWKAELYFGLGTLQLEAGEGEAAAHSFEAALVDEPGNKEARIGLGLARTLQGRLAEAEACFDAILAVDPENELAKTWKARCARTRRETKGVEVPRPTREGAPV